MANNYCEGSSFLNVPADKIEQAREIVDRVSKEIEDGDDGAVFVDIEVQEDGVWFSSGENMSAEHVEMIARELVEELEIDDVFVCSWAYTCSRKRVDEFGGGAFALRRGVPTQWVDAASLAEEKLVRQGGGARTITDEERYNKLLDDYVTALLPGKRGRLIYCQIATVQQSLKRSAARNNTVSEAARDLVDNLCVSLLEAKCDEAVAVVKLPRLTRGTDDGS